MLINALIMTAALAVSAGKVEDPVDEDCKLASITTIEVPAEQSGPLMSIEVKEGMMVKEGMELGKIDDREAKMDAEVKKYDYEVADYKAKSEVSVRYARKAADVAKKVYELYQEANKNGPVKTIATTEMMKYKLEYEKAFLGIEKEIEELKVADLTTKGKGAEYQAAKLALAKRTLRSPIDGIVIKVFRQPGEWVAPGETVFKIVRVDRLKIVANMDATKYGRADLDGRSATVEVSLPHDEKKSVTGKVVAVAPVVLGGALLPIIVEIESPLDKDGEPIFFAGQQAKLTVHVNTPTGAALGSPKAPRK
jgi:multidrug resistance efflux pump